MLLEPRPEPHAGTAAASGLLARATAEEEEPIRKSSDPGLRDRRDPIPPATIDAGLVTLWLHGESAHTTRAYSEDVATFTGKSLRATYLSDL